MPRRNRRIEVVPVWRDQVDEKLLILALLGFIDQLAAEEAKAGGKSGWGAPNA